MSERHGDIDRKEHYYVIKAWEDSDGNKYYLFDHDTCAVRFSEGAVFDNKLGVWISAKDNSDKDNEFCDDIWSKLNMDKAAEKIIMEVQDAIEATEKG